MKNKIKLIAIFAFVVVIGFTMAACGGGGAGGQLSGTYTTDDGSISYTFSGKKVVAEAFGQKGEATYELKGGKFIMTSPDGRTESYDYTLSGNTLSFDWYGIPIVLNKK